MYSLRRETVKKMPFIKTSPETAKLHIENYIKYNPVKNTYTDKSICSPTLHSNKDNFSDEKFCC